MSPYLTASFLGLTSAIADVHVFKRSICYRNIAVLGVVGFALGAGFSQGTESILYHRTFDEDIVNAFD